MDFEKDYLDVEEEFEKPELTKGATRDTDPQYFTNIDGIYAKDAAGRAAVEELRTLVTGYSETVLYKMTDYSISQQTTVALSDDVTNYDSIVVFGIFKANSSSTNFWRTRARADIMVSQYDFTKEFPDTFLLHNSTESISIKGNYCFSDTSTITRTAGDSTWIEKVIGIKYPGLYVPPVSLNQAPVTLLTQQTEEPTDEMR